MSIRQVSLRRGRCGLSLLQQQLLLMLLCTGNVKVNYYY